ncbi:hypothetical protein F4820DRAFT_469180 [Hypoxylon rubiginosum]|uniref:Uncharacterized protein n=1 Tax=Hypoxylon rubiginosum TaxID=110542 RepID=A0ACB9Z3S4_9PEZI|nr:hypothetical protein F4820DRAFT_469180 [Hypoxylon rubiginosum]
MCQSCSTLVQRNFSCGHQLLLRKGNATFCLFYPHTTEEYHAVYTKFESKPRGDECKECQIRTKAGNQGLGLRGPERLDFIKKTYAKTWEAKSREEAKNSVTLAKKSQQVTDAEQIAKLNKKAQEQVKFYMGRRGRLQLDTFKRGNLLKIILEAPDAIDRKALLSVFGSYCVWDQKENVWKGMPSEERNHLMGIARRAGYGRTLEAGLAMKKPEDLQQVVEKTAA